MMRFLNLQSIGLFSCTNKRLYQAASDNKEWIIRLTKEKIIPLFGKSWEEFSSHILSYKSYYATIHILQDFSKNEEGSIESYLKSAILPDSVFSHQCLSLLYEMFGQKKKALESLYKAGGLGNKLSQELVVRNLHEGHEPPEDRYQKLRSLAENGGKEAQDEVVEALYSFRFGWDENHDEMRYQELLSLARRGWGMRGGYGSGLVRVPDTFFRVVCTLYEGKLGQDKCAGEERYQELLSLAEEGWESAQEKVVRILYWGEFGQDQVPEEERYRKILFWAERGWYDAQKLIAKALVEGTFGQEKRSEKERYEELVAFAEKGWESVQYEIINNVLKWGRLGWEKRPEEEGYQELFSFAERGWKQAQYQVVDDIYRRSNYGIDKRPVKERYQELVACAERGWGFARSDIARLLYEGKLDWAKIPEEQQYEQLAFFAEKGWGDRRYVCYALKRGTHGCGKMLLEERYNALVSLAERGDENAQSSVISAVSGGNFGWNKVPGEERYQQLLMFAEKQWYLVDREIVDALYNGNLGCDKILEEERYQELVSLGMEKITKNGWESAQSKVISAIEDGKLGWDKRSEEERYEELVFLAERGWRTAQKKISDAHIFNIIGGYHSEQGWTSIQDGSYAGHPGKSRSSAPSYFKKYKNVAYFQLLRTLIEGKYATK